MSDTTMNKTIRRKKRRKRIRKLIVWLVILLLGVGAVYLFVIPKLQAATTITYESYTATRGTISNSMSFTGSIDVVNDETLASGSAGTVRKIYVDTNDTVSTGDRLMRLSNGEIIRASFDGEVNDIYVEEGDEVSANESLIQIVDFVNLQVSIRVDEYSIVNVSAGQACDVTVTALEQTFESVITHINRIPAGGTSTSYYTVTAEFSGSGDVLPGMQVTVVIPEEEATDAVIVNSDALSFGPANNAYVLVQNEDGDMEQVFVKTGVDNDNYVQIISGISAGTTVYKEVETIEEASGLLSLFSSLQGTQQQNAGGTMPENMGDFDPTTMWQNRTFDGSNFGGGMP
ncbi:MAG: HlyD family efflux transporter periplasmic adaptor subunit [Clostridiales bacterium]|nr:HlyD family efflux transporter periplasmic adaptor subunit [Clostridiales bacterium]